MMRKKKNNLKSPRSLKSQKSLKRIKRQIRKKIKKLRTEQLRDILETERSKSA